MAPGNRAPPPPITIFFGSVVSVGDYFPRRGTAPRSSTPPPARRRVREHTHVKVRCLKVRVGTAARELVRVAAGPCVRCFTAFKVGVRRVILVEARREPRGHLDGLRLDAGVKLGLVRGVDGRRFGEVQLHVEYVRRCILEVLARCVLLLAAGRRARAEEDLIVAHPHRLNGARITHVNKVCVQGILVGGVDSRPTDHDIAIVIAVDIAENERREVHTVVGAGRRESEADHSRHSWHDVGVGEQGGRNHARWDPARHGHDGGHTVAALPRRKLARGSAPQAAFLVEALERPLASSEALYCVRPVTLDVPRPIVGRNND
mmetsp:Transcript_26032/g.69282  ORF Transcript_26032/g.69282 Transcript_26032/m.69282 type:complete len:318 (-) Transcript_26032:1382-2335(-)